MSVSFYLLLPQHSDLVDVLELSRNAAHGVDSLLAVDDDFFKFEDSVSFRTDVGLGIFVTRWNSNLSFGLLSSFGIDFHTEIEMQMMYDRPYTPQFEQMMNVIVELPVILGSDALFCVNLEDILLVRKDGIWTLNNLSNFWDRTRRDALTDRGIHFFEQKLGVLQIASLGIDEV